MKKTPEGKSGVKLSTTQGVAMAKQRTQFYAV